MAPSLLLSNGADARVGAPQVLPADSSVLPKRHTRYCNVPKINEERLWEDIQSTARFGSIPGTEGMRRLALSNEDKEVRQWFRAQAAAIGCTVSVDTMGNIFAVLPGQDEGDRPPLAMGSHLDTQPAGGKYDGILGVLAGLEALRTIKDSGWRTWSPIAVVVWTNEEGAAFFPGCSGSSVWADWVNLEKAYQQVHCQRAEETLGSALQKIAERGPVSASYLANPLSAHIELHIEQGPLLETERRGIGVVRRIQGIRRYTIVCRGLQGHAGTMPMQERADALIAAAKFILKVEEMAFARQACATVGVLKVDQPSPNTIPSLVELTVDARHLEESVLDDLEQCMLAYLDTLSGEKEMWSFSTSRQWHSPALSFDPDVLDCIRSAAVEEYGEKQVMDMISLAGHDSAMTAMRVPTAMIFVPSRDGISHSPLEFTSKQHCGQGAQVMLAAVLRFDEALRERHQSQLPQ